MRASLLLLIALGTSCTSPDRTAISDIDKRYVTTYYDRNHDGVVDFELHDIPGAADAAWALSDTKFRGRYNVRLKFGFAFARERVDLPIPKNVKIVHAKPPVFTTQ